jgi:hypothetical protein
LKFHCRLNKNCLKITHCLFISTPHEGKVLTANDVDSVNDICFKSYDQSCRLSKTKLMIVRFNPNICIMRISHKVTFTVFLFGI